MSERAPDTATDRPRRPVRRAPRKLPVYAVSAALFLGAFGFLANRVAVGQDPALGAGRPAAVTAARQVVVRRVVVTKRVVVVKPAADATSTSSGSGSGSSGTPVPSAPAAPTQVAQAPAPAPAPAPVQTATS